MHFFCKVVKCLRTQCTVSDKIVPGEKEEKFFLQFNTKLIVSDEKLKYLTTRFTVGLVLAQVTFEQY